MLKTIKQWELTGALWTLVKWLILGVTCYLVSVVFSYLISGYDSLYKKQRFIWSKTDLDKKKEHPET